MPINNAAAPPIERRSPDACPVCWVLGFKLFPDYEVMLKPKYPVCLGMEMRALEFILVILGCFAVYLRPYEPQRRTDFNI